MLRSKKKKKERERERERIIKLDSVQKWTSTVKVMKPCALTVSVETPQF
jgi:hypothetical protein